MTTKRAIIFDFDGTIADSFEYVLSFLQGEAGKNPPKTGADQLLLRQMSMKRLALHLGIPVWRLPLLYFKGRRIMRGHMEHVALFKGMDEVIRSLADSGYLLFIVSSNSSHNIRRFLRRHHLSQFFVGVRGGAGMGGKANIIRQLMLRHRLTKSETWYIGDEAGDVMAAARAGIKCLAVGWGFANPDKIQQLRPEAFAEHPDDIPGVLKAAWKK